MEALVGVLNTDDNVGIVADVTDKLPTVFMVVFVGVSVELVVFDVDKVTLDGFGVTVVSITDTGIVGGLIVVFMVVVDEGLVDFIVHKEALGDVCVVNKELEITVVVEGSLKGNEADTSFCVV